MNESSYNKIASQWAEIRKNSFVSKLVKDFAERICSQGKILDIGCGTGFPIAKYLAEKGFFVTGIDDAEQMIAIARSSKIDDTEFIESDFFNFVSTPKFDGTLAWDSFSHFPKVKQESIYSKAGSLLKTDGYLLFTHGNVNDEHVDTMMGEPFYYSSLSKQRVFELLNNNGFNVEYAYDDFVEGNTHRAFVVLAKKMPG